MGGYKHCNAEARSLIPHHLKPWQDGECAWTDITLRQHVCTICVAPKQVWISHAALKTKGTDNNNACDTTAACTRGEQTGLQLKAKQLPAVRQNGHIM